MQSIEGNLAELNGIPAAAIAGRNTGQQATKEE